ncbi:MAG: hypothetical protein ACKV2T_00650 [Kofleriaceae bacterium]
MIQHGAPDADVVTCLGHHTRDTIVLTRSDTTATMPTPRVTATPTAASLMTGELASLLRRDDLVHLEQVDLKGIDAPTALVTLSRYR